MFPIPTFAASIVAPAFAFGALQQLFGASHCQLFASPSCNVASQGIFHHHATRGSLPHHSGDRAVWHHCSAYCVLRLNCADSISGHLRFQHCRSTRISQASLQNLLHAKLWSPSWLVSRRNKQVPKALLGNTQKRGVDWDILGIFVANLNNRTRNAQTEEGTRASLCSLRSSDQHLPWHLCRSSPRYLPVFFFAHFSSLHCSLRWHLGILTFWEYLRTVCATLLCWPRLLLLEPKWLHN